MNRCVVCLNESEALCQRCRTHYCSRKCQTDDWQNHKMICIPMPPLITAKKPAFDKSKQQNQNELKESTVSTKLRPPKTQLPNEKLFPADVKNVKKSLFDNPFKRNSQNISFTSNEYKSSLSNRLQRNVPESAIPAKDTKNDVENGIQNLAFQETEKEVVDSLQQKE